MSLGVRQLVYRPDGAVLSAFVRDVSPVAIIQGPIGSGKSVGSAMRVWKHIHEQAVSPDGVRRSRWAIVRDTYRNLENTTVKTWLEWFGDKQYGEFFFAKPMRHKIRYADIESEVIFFPLDAPDDIASLKSLELTGIWINEGQFMDKYLFDEAQSRVGRYPRVVDGGPSWSGVLVDMNAPPPGHWVSVMRGDEPPPDHLSAEDAMGLVAPPGWRFFVQPPGLIERRDASGRVVGYRANPVAENQKYLPPDYYVGKAQGKPKVWIDANVMNVSGASRDGKPVHPDFRREAHVAASAITVVPECDIHVGLDFGRSPCAVFAQEFRGRWFVIAELVSEDMGMGRFSPILKRRMRELAPGFGLERFKLWGDPSGDFKNQATEDTPFKVARTHGLVIRPAWGGGQGGQNFSIRREALDSCLVRLVDGQPGLLVSPRCPIVIGGLQGGYRWPTKRGDNESETPVKDRWSHPVEALHYLLLGAGEGRKVMVGGGEDRRPQKVKRAFRYRFA